MRAAGRPGGPEVLEVADRPVREPAPGEVRIAVRAAAVNPADVELCAAGRGDLTAPRTPGVDAAGTVDAVGPGVDRLAVGDAGMAAVNPFRPDGGGQAERLVVPAAWAAPIPDGATIEEAATLPMNRSLLPEQGGEPRAQPPRGRRATASRSDCLDGKCL